MNEHGREAMLSWRMWRPMAYDALPDPVAHFTALGERFDRLLGDRVNERLAHESRRREELENEDDLQIRRANIHNEVFGLVRCELDNEAPPYESGAGAPDPPDGWLRDPARRYAGVDGWPVDPRHLVSLMLADPLVPAAALHEARAAWIATVPEEPAIAVVGEAFADEVLAEALNHRRPNPHGWTPEARTGSPGERLREDEYGVVVRTETAILNYGGDFAREADRAFQLLRWAHENEKRWAVAGTLLWEALPTLVLPPLLGDGSEVDPTAMAEMMAECGALEPESQYVVTNGQPRVIDYGAVGWSTITDHPRQSTAGKPLLLIDVDGCLSPYNRRDERLPGFTDLEMWGHLQVHLPRVQRLFALADRYELVWATTWDDTANGLAQRLGLPELPFIRFLGESPPRVHGFDNWKTHHVLDYVGDRPFAWLDDWPSRDDARYLVEHHDCLVVRTAPRRGIEDHQLDAVEAWASQ